MGRNTRGKYFWYAILLRFAADVIFFMSLAGGLIFPASANKHFQNLFPANFIINLLYIFKFCSQIILFGIFSNDNLRTFLLRLELLIIICLVLSYLLTDQFLYWAVESFCPFVYNTFILHCLTNVVTYLNYVANN